MIEVKRNKNWTLSCDAFIAAASVNPSHLLIQKVIMAVIVAEYSDIITLPNRFSADGHG